MTAALLLCATILSPSTASAQKVALVFSGYPSWAADVRATSQNSGSCSQVDLIDASSSTPSLTTLQQYAAVSDGARLMASAVRWAAPVKVALVTPDPAWFVTDDLRSKLSGTGLISQVDVIDPNVAPPTLATLRQYNAVMVFWGYNEFTNPIALGNVLADYVDSGGGVVQATFAFYSWGGRGLNGRWDTPGYLPFTEGNDKRDGATQYLVADQPDHPILQAVASVNGGTVAHNILLTVTTGTTLVAHWTDGEPLLGARSGPVNGRIVGLNMWPGSSDVRSHWWNTATDGARLMANALVWTAGTASAPNQPPTANAGVDQTKEATAAAGASFTVNGSASSDLEGKPLTYSWSGPFAGSPMSGVSPTIMLPPPAAPGKTATYVVTLTVSDGQGGTATDTVSLTVTDLTAPVISGTAAPITVFTSSPGGVPVTYGPVTANDAVDGPRPVTCAPAPGSVFPIGTTTVSCTSSDTRSNAIAATFTVTVVPDLNVTSITLETRRWNGHVPTSSSDAVTTYFSLPLGQPGYAPAPKTLTLFSNVGNQITFNGVNDNIGYHHHFAFYAPQAGSLTVQMGADFGAGGTLLIDGVLVQFRNTDMWWNGSYANPLQILSGTVNISAGPHVIDTYGFEGCCDGAQEARYSYLGGPFKIFTAPANAVPSVTLSGPATATAGTTQTFTFAVADPDAGATFSVNAVSCGAGGVQVGTVSTNAGGGSFQCSFPSAPATPVVSVTVADNLGAQSNTATRTVTVSAPPAPPFSLPFTAPPGACLCTPLLMNTNVAGTQYWFVKAAGGALTLTVSAHAVTAGLGETVSAQAYDVATGAPMFAAPLSASYTAAEAAPGFVRSASGTFAGGAGGVYRIEVTTPGADPRQPHYKLEIDQGGQALATLSPSSPSFEHDGPSTWWFNVASGEDLDVRFFSDGTPSAPPVTVTVRLISPDGSIGGAQTYTIADAVAGYVFSVPGAPAGTWGLEIDAEQHWRMEKTSGVDRGLYLNWRSAGYGSLAVDVAGGAGFPGAQYSVFDASGERVPVDRLGNLPVGSYSVRVHPLPGWAVDGPDVVDVDVFCERAALVSFLFVDRTPPVVSVPGDVVREATGPSGAVVVFESSANDAVDGVVPVSCTWSSGDTFPIGTTTVACSATDANGNTGTASFAVTVVDTTAPACDCTPSYNPSTRNVPQASRTNQDGYYRVTATDIVSNVRLMLGSYELVQGETIKVTQAPGQSSVTLVNSMGREPIRHFRVGPGDAQIKATDATGNVTTITCLVPPPPK